MKRCPQKTNIILQNLENGVDKTMGGGGVQWILLEVVF